MGDEGFSDRQRRAAIGEADLNHDACVVGDKEVAQSVTVRFRERHPPEVILGPCAYWAGVGEPSSFAADGQQSLSDIRHRESMPDVTLLEGTAAYRTRWRPASGATLEQRTAQFMPNVHHGTRPADTFRIVQSKRRTRS